MPISDTKARSAKPREKVYRIADSGGLCLEVRPSGAKTWRYRYRLDGTANMFTIGNYPTVGLSQARERRDWARGLVASGVHPRDQVKKDKQDASLQKLNTFESVADEWFEKRKTEWSRTYAHQVRGTLDNDIFPALGKRPIREIGPQDVLDMLRGIEKRGASSVASLARQWTSAIFRYGVVTLRTDTDPAEFVKGAVSRGAVKHATALSRDELKNLMAQLSVFGGYRTTQLSIRLLMLTMVRTIELRRGRWEHIDWDERLWRIPKEHMKSRRPHLVPLSRQALEVLTELREHTGNSPILVPGMKSPRNPIHLTTINTAISRMNLGVRFSAHGFRATASTHMNEAGWPADAIERQLAHDSRDKVRGSYNHAQYLDTRRDMLQWWADFIDAL